MATKNNIRSIRFSDDLAELIDRQVGENFSQKFENLIQRCVWELPKREQDLKNIETRITETREKLYNLERQTEQLRMLEQDMKSAQRDLALVSRRTKAIADAAEKGNV